MRSRKMSARWLSIVDEHTEDRARLGRNEMICLVQPHQVPESSLIDDGSGRFASRDLRPEASALRRDQAAVR
jgi:hypothetical protein